MNTNTPQFAMWSPTMAVREAIGYRPDELEVSVRVEFIKQLSVVSEGVLRDWYALIKFKERELIVPIQTLDLKEVIVPPVNRNRSLQFNSKWWENAPNNEAVPLSRDSLDKWCDEMDLQTASNVWHRYIMTRGNFKSIGSWMKRQFFFRNASSRQLEIIEQAVRFHIFAK